MTEANRAPEPGIYRDVPFDEYLSWAYVNNGALGAAARSPQHYQNMLAREQEPTDAMRFGALVHCGQLEPAAIGSRYAVMPDFASQIRREDGSEYTNVKATRQYKEAVAKWRETIGDREEVTAEHLELLLGMSRSLVMHDTARSWLCAAGPVEVSIVWDDRDTGVRCKGRVDKWVQVGGSHMLVDLKTSRDVARFEDAIGRFHYHRQAAFYVDGVRTLLKTDKVQFGLVAVEKEPPYGVRAARISEDAIAVGREEYKGTLETVAECLRTDYWPGYDSPHQWVLPDWYQARSEGETVGVCINGEIVI